MPPYAAAPDAAFAADVRAFAAAFWSLPPADRRARWRELAGRPVGPAAARLADLEPGLGVAPAAQPDPRAAELADLVRELFVLPPAERAARRGAWLAVAARRDPAWAAASRAVLRTDLPLARLDERLFDWFSTGDRPAAVAAVADADAWVRRPGRPVHQPGRPVLDPGAAVVPAANAGGLGCLTGPGAVIFALFVIVRIIIAAAGSSRSTPPPTYTPPPAYTPAPSAWVPPTTGAQPADPNAPFTDGEVARFREYEDRKKAGLLRPSDRVTQRYTRWVDLGRPAAVGQP